MPYSDIRLEDLENKYKLQYKGTYLFRGLAIANVNPSQHLATDLRESEQIPIFSEKAKSELMIMPILKEIWRQKPDKLSILSGFALNVNSDLNGICDYILSAVPYAITLQSPIFCLVEAKNRAVEEGYGQCAAEMYAAQLFNQQKNKKLDTIYGCVTNGFDWQFLKLENNTIFIDFERHSANKRLEELLGVLHYITTQTTLNRL